MLPFLADQGYQTEILFEPKEDTETPTLDSEARRIMSRGCDIVYFQKTHGPSVERLVTQLNKEGVRTVFGVCDLVVPAMADKTDMTVIVTEHLKKLYPRELWEKIQVVHDGIERPEYVKTSYSDLRGSSKRPLRAVLVTSSAPHTIPVIETLPEWLSVTICAAYPAQRLHRLKQIRWQSQLLGWNERCSFAKFLLSRRIECRPWEPTDVYEQLTKADIGIIPIKADSSDNPKRLRHWEIKSENRLTLKMSVGLPVIATPIPSYEPIVVQGTNGFLARGREEWMAALEALREPSTRIAIGQSARQAVIRRYSMEEQARLLIQALESCRAEEARSVAVSRTGSI